MKKCSHIFVTETDLTDTFFDCVLHCYTWRYPTASYYEYLLFSPLFTLTVNEETCYMVLGSIFSFEDK